MSKLIADIFVTIKPTPKRLPMTVQSLKSLYTSLKKDEYRLTVCIDGRMTEHMDPVPEGLLERLAQADYMLESRENEGLGPTINRAIAHICSINDWYGHPTHGDPDRVAPFIVCCQDDCEYERNWLPVLASRFLAYGRVNQIGFASGHDAPEHEYRAKLGDGIFLKDWIRMTNVLGKREYWQSLMPIPRLDPETGRVRAKPNDGMGSSVDWHIIRNHENSICRSGKTCLVVPGLVRHIGFQNSTWLDRPLPENP